MDALHQYINLSKEMLSILDNNHTRDQNRDELINKITQMIANRQAFVDQIKPPYSKESQELGKQAMEVDQQLNGKLQMLFQHVKKDMRNTKKQQRSNSQYMNPYQSISSLDGRFLDSKK